MLFEFSRHLLALLLIYLTLTVIRRVLPRSSWFHSWRREYGWSLFVPLGVVPALISFGLKRDWSGVGKCFLLGIVFCFVWRYAQIPAYIGFRFDAHQIAMIVSRVRTEEGGYPFENHARTYHFRNFVRDRDKERIHEAWAETQQSYYSAMIKAKAPGLTLAETRVKLGYDRLQPSLQEQLDLAWEALQEAPRKALLQHQAAPPSTRNTHRAP